MMVFWLLATIMVMAAIAVLIPSLLSKQTAKNVSRDEAIVAAIRERLSELQNERNAQTLSAEAFNQERAELESRLLEELGEENETSASPIQRSGWFSILVIAFALPAGAISLYLNLGQPTLIVNPSTVARQGAPVQNTPSVEEMVAQLEEMLKRQPEDATGWVWLGRGYISMNRAAEAKIAFARALDLQGDSAELLADYAESIVLESGGAINSQTAEFVQRALKIDPNHTKALWLAGMAAIQNDDVEGASKYWKPLIAQMPADSQEREILQQVLAQASEAGPDEPANAKSGEIEKPAAIASLTVNVSLDESMENRVSPDSTLFIFARAAQGPRMPLAIVRKKASDLPITVTLDDTMAMSEGMNLSSFESVVVGARISASGNAMPQNGDIEGYSEPTSVNRSDKLKILLNRLVP